MQILYVKFLCHFVLHKRITQFVSDSWASCCSQYKVYTLQPWQEDREKEEEKVGRQAGVHRACWRRCRVWWQSVRGWDDTWQTRRCSAWQHNRLSARRPSAGRRSQPRLADHPLEANYTSQPTTHHHHCHSVARQCYTVVRTMQQVNGKWQFWGIRTP